MSNITVTELQGHTSGGDANTVKVKSGHTLAAQSNATVGGTLGVTGTTTTAQIDASGSINTTANTISVTNSSYPQLQLNSGVKNYHIFNDTGGNSLYFKNATDNVNGMIMDSSGRITQPAQPAFQAHSGASSTADSNTIIFIATDYNIGSHYSTSTGRFTAPIAGRYLFTVNGIYTLSSSSQTFKWIWRKNGANTGVLAEWQTSNVTGSFNTIGNCSIILQLAANDWVDVYNNSASGAGAAHISGAQTRFCGILLT